MTTKLPSIPDFDGQNVGDVLSALKQAMEVRTGVRGESLDAGVTFRDLTVLGLATDNSGGAGSGAGKELSTPNAPVSPLFGSTSPLYDPTTDLTTPPAPTDLMLTTVFDSVMLTWNCSGFPNQSYWEVYRSYSNDLASAQLLGTSTSQFYTDPVGPNRTVYYWVRTVSAAGVKSAWNAAAGTAATTTEAPAAQIAALAKDVMNSQLFRALTSNVDDLATAQSIQKTKIAGLQLTYGSVASAALSATQAAISESNAIAAQAQAIAAKTGAEAAQTAANSAAQVASTSAGVAASAESNALGYSNSAANSSSLAASYKTDAENAATVATSSKIEANSAKDAALGSANAAAVSAATASTQSTNAGNSATAAQLSAINAAASETNASAFATSAVTASNTATQKAAEAQSSAGVAAVSEQSATQAASAASTSANLASTKSDESSSYATAAYNYSVSANGSKVAAGVSATNAATSESNALGYKNAAAQSLLDVRATIRGTSYVLPLEQWNLNGQSMVTISDGKVGNRALRLVGAGGAYPNQGNYVAIDPTKKYRVKFWARPSSDAAGLLYFSLRQFLDDQGTAGPANGGRSPYKPSGWNRAAHVATYGTGWGEYSYLWDVNDWQSGVKYFQPEFLDNYSGAAGYWEIQNLMIYDATDAEAITASVTQESIARVASDNSLFSQYTVKIDTGGYVSGFGLASEAVNGTVKSSFMVRADSFSIVQAGADQRTVTSISAYYVSDKWSGTSIFQGYLINIPSGTGMPFGVGDTVAFNGINGFTGNATVIAVVSQTQFEVGEPWTLVTGGSYTVGPDAKVSRVTAPFTVSNGKVYISTAVIGDASITSAKIASLEAKKITSGYVTAIVGFAGAKVFGGSLYSGGTTTALYDSSNNIIGFTANNPTFAVANGNVTIVSANFKIKTAADAFTEDTPFEVVDGYTRIKNAWINHVTIGFGQVTGVLQSDNYSDTDKTGWKLTKDGGGTAILNSATIRGTLQSDDGNFKIDLKNKYISISV